MSQDPTQLAEDIKDEDETTQQAQGVEVYCNPALRSPCHEEELPLRTAGMQWREGGRPRAAYISARAESSRDFPRSMMQSQGSVPVDVSLQSALAMYRLHSAQIHCETSMDTRCLVAWSQTMIVIAFRGTASLANVKADLQASRQATTPSKKSVTHCLRLADKYWLVL